MLESSGVREKLHDVDQDHSHFRRGRSAARGVTDEAGSIVASHSLIPDALFHAFATFGVLMSPDLPLTRRQHEMITTVVSVTNRCHY